MTEILEISTKAAYVRWLTNDWSIGDLQHGPVFKTYTPLTTF